jgi:hypothetical protein
MALYFILGSRDLRARVTAACGSFYMPFDFCAVVPFDGTAEQLARRLILLSNEDPPRRSGYPLGPLKHAWVARLFLS